MTSGIKPADEFARLIMSEAYVTTYGEDTGSFVEYEAKDVVAHIEADRASVRDAALVEAIMLIRGEIDKFHGLAKGIYDERRHGLNREAATLRIYAVELLEKLLPPSECQVCDGSGYGHDSNYTGQGKLIMPCRACHPAWWQQMEREGRTVMDAHSFPPRRRSREAGQ